MVKAKRICVVVCIAGIILISSIITSCVQSMQKHLDMASDYFGKGQYSEAAVEYGKAIALGPTDKNTLKTAYAFRGYSYYDAGEYDLAIPDFIKANELGSVDIMVLQHLGLSYYKTQQFDKAIAELTKAIKANPDYSAFVYDDRGLAYAARGDNDLAIADFNQAIKMFQGDALAYSRRAEVYIASGQTDLAIADLRKALSIAEDTDMQQTIKGRLTALGIAD